MVIRTCDLARKASCLSSYLIPTSLTSIASYSHVFKIISEFFSKRGGDRRDGNYEMQKMI